MNTGHCLFCGKRLRKTARYDAEYCSGAHRMAARRQREREEKIRAKALLGEPTGGPPVTTFEEEQENRAATAKAQIEADRDALLSRLQTRRVATGLPPLIQNRHTNLMADFFAVKKSIDHYAQLHNEAVTYKRELIAELEQFGEIQTTDSDTGIADVDEILDLPRGSTPDASPHIPSLSPP